MNLGWRAHDAISQQESLPAEAQSEFENVGAELVIPPIEIYRPSQGGYESVDWIVAQLTSIVTLVERYRALVASRTFFSKSPSKAAFYPINVASQHMLGVTYIAAQSMEKKVPFPVHQYQIGQTLSQMFVFSWKLFGDKKKSRALIDLDFVLAKPPQGLPPTTEEELFSRLKDRDLEGAGYNMKTVKKVADLDDKAKAKPVEQIVFDLLNYFYETRNVFTNNQPIESIKDANIKSTCLLALRQASLFVRYFASVLYEASEPKQYARTFRLLDELTDVTYDLSLAIGNLTGPLVPSVGGYPSSERTGTGYNSEAVSFIDQVNQAEKLARRIGHDHVPPPDADTAALSPYADARVLLSQFKPAY